MNRSGPVLLAALLLVAGCVSQTRQSPASQPALRPVPLSFDTPEPVQARPSIGAAIADGVAFLVKSQNPDGSSQRADRVVSPLSMR